MIPIVFKKREKWWICFRVGLTFVHVIISESDSACSSYLVSHHQVLVKLSAHCFTVENHSPVGDFTVAMSRIWSLQLFFFLITLHHLSSSDLLAGCCLSKLSQGPLRDWGESITGANLKSPCQQTQRGGWSRRAQNVYTWKPARVHMERSQDLLAVRW